MMQPNGDVGPPNKHVSMCPNGNPMVKYASRRTSIKPTIPLYTFDLAPDDE
jgi:hypothetical protein